MFKAKWTTEAADEYNALSAAARHALAARQKTGKTKSSRQEGLFKQVHECIQKLLANPKHPGLKIPPFTSLPHPWNKNQKAFEAYAQNNTPGACRIFWCYGPNPNEITLLAITPHP